MWRPRTGHSRSSTSWPGSQGSAPCWSGCRAIRRRRIPTNEDHTKTGALSSSHKRFGSIVIVNLRHPLRGQGEPSAEPAVTPRSLAELRGLLALVRRLHARGVACQEEHDDDGAGQRTLAASQATDHAAASGDLTETGALSPRQSPP